MELNLASTCDALALGSGITGISAASTAAEFSALVILVCKSRLFSGSSFYPGTWGLGLVGSADEADEADLIPTIEDADCGMADDALARALVKGIHPATGKVCSMGVRFREADKNGQQEYIPCFDHKHRDWNGVEFDSARETFSQRLEELGVIVLSGREMLELVHVDSRVCGIAVMDGVELHYLGCKVLVLATGGYGNLFRHHLCIPDVERLGQALALEAGCRLVNMELMQITPGYLSPAHQTISNEKAFRFTGPRRPDGAPLLEGEMASLLELCATHDLFTARLPSKAVDLAIYRVCLEGKWGVRVTYSDEMCYSPPEFVKTHFDWLREVRGLTMEDSIQIGMSAHAANGGVWITPDTSTGVPSLFAAGEVTGGMHGADRISGLSTANGLVFGGKAGSSAAVACTVVREPPKTCFFKVVAAANRQKVFTDLQDTMFHYVMVEWDEAGLSATLERVKGLSSVPILTPTDNVDEIARTRRRTGQPCTVRCILKAALMRQESRDAHYRADHLCEKPAVARLTCVTCQGGAIQARFIEEGTTPYLQQNKRFGGWEIMWVQHPSQLTLMPFGASG